MPPQSPFDPNSSDSQFASIHAKLDTIIARLDDHKNTITIHADDISKLKQWRGYIIGIATGAGYLIHVVSDYLTGGSHK